MPCGVKSCSISDDRFLWKCEFCNKKYHAACVGVQRQREHFITAFMVPLCADCQLILRKEADVRKLLHQQEQLVDAIRFQTDANHRIAADLKKFCIVSELFESIEHLLEDVKGTLAVTIENNQNISSTVGQHIKSCDLHIHTTMAGIIESNSTMAQKITEHFDERLLSISNDMALLSKDAESSSPPLYYDDSKLREILEEVKFVSGAVSSLQINATNNTKPHQKTLEEELAERSSVHNTVISKEHTSPGWRFLGHKWHWKQDWSKVDAKQRARRLQEKAAEKAKRIRKSKKQQFTHTRRPDYDNKPNKNFKGNERHTQKSDKELLATAKVQFSSPPTSTDHPIAALSVSKLINFKKGETINPYRAENQTQQHTEASTIENTDTSTYRESNSIPSRSFYTMRPPPSVSMTQQSADHPPLLDPMRPPIVRLTEQSASGDQRFLKARLRDPKIMDLVRTYLSFLHDQPPSVCIRGITKISATLILAAEGLPTDIKFLREIFLDVHAELGIPRNDALADLQSHRAFLSSERTERLQRSREAALKFYNPSNFRKH